MKQIVRVAFTVALLTACASAGLAAAVASSGLAKKKAIVPAVRPGTRYLALGDSVTFGYMESTVIPAPSYSNPASFLGFPEQLGAALHLIVANAACPGETSASLNNSSAPSYGCEGSPPGGSTGGYRQRHPLHVRYEGSQLAYALSYLHSHHDVTLVSLMIGANDYFLCQSTTSDHCSSLAEEEALLAELRANVRRTLSAIRNRAHYEGQLAIVNYYSLDYASALDDLESLTLNEAVDSAAKPFHVVIADGYGELRAASSHSGNNTCTAGLLTQLATPGKCGVHPSYAGQALLAQSLAKVLKL